MLRPRDSVTSDQGVATTPVSPGRSLEICKICGSSSAHFGSAEVLRKYKVQYFRCERCGFIQTEAPYWVGESYSSAIARQDVGVMQRNLVNAELTSAVLKLMFSDVKSALDFGAGHGVFVRMMRDKGFKFSWFDLYATNAYARGFESNEGGTFDFLTAFEVLEHLTDPVLDLQKMMNLSDNVFVSTCLVPEPPPHPDKWWYYAPLSGQHVSFYTERSLRQLAARFGRHLLSAGSYHLFSKRARNPVLYKLATKPRLARITNFISRRPTLIERDFQQMSN